MRLSQIECIVAVALHDIWGRGLDEVYATGEGAGVLARRNKMWREIKSGGSVHAFAVWGPPSGTALYAAGDRAAIAFLEGPDDAEWEITDLPNGHRLLGLAGSGPSDVVAVGWDGVIWHYDGRRWRLAREPGGADLVSVWSDRDGWVIAVGDVILCRANPGSEFRRCGDQRRAVAVDGARPGEAWGVAPGSPIVRFTKRGAYPCSAELDAIDIAAERAGTGARLWILHDDGHVSTYGSR